MENGSDDSPSFSCQSLFPNGLGSHGPEGSRLDLRRVGTAKPPPSPSLPTATSVRTPIALRPKPPSTTSYSEKNETPSPRQKTKAKENLESTFQSRCSGVHRSDGSGAHGTIKGGAVDRSSSCDPSRATNNTVVYDLTASDVTGTTSGNVDGVAASEENMADSGDTAVSTTRYYEEGTGRKILSERHTSHGCLGRKAFIIGTPSICRVKVFTIILYSVVAHSPVVSRRDDRRNFHMQHTRAHHLTAR